jgi:hypothetical protein
VNTFHKKKVRRMRVDFTGVQQISVLAVLALVSTRTVQADPSPRNQYRADAHGPIFTAVAAVRDAKSEAEMENASRKLTEMLQESFDNDVVEREKEINKLEERVAKLRDIVQRRRKERAGIIDLQIKVVVNEAKGLRFKSNDGADQKVQMGYSSYRSGPAGHSSEGFSTDVHFDGRANGHSCGGTSSRPAAD